MHPVAELPELLPQADVVVLLAPVTSETAGMVDAEFLASMKDGALLVNGARGTLVRTDDLVAELASGRLFAALDVTDPEPLPGDPSALGSAERTDYPARRGYHLAVGDDCSRVPSRAGAARSSDIRYLTSLPVNTERSFSTLWSHLLLSSIEA